MFSEALYDQILELPDAPALVQRVSEYLHEERARREKFYNDIDESIKAEFIGGQIVVHSPVMLEHNVATGLLFKLVDTYVIQNDLGFVGIEKIMTVFPRNDYEPDICYFGNEKAKNFTEGQTLFPIPDFVVEILSKATSKIDRGIKFDDYEANGVKEYWIIDPRKQQVEQYCLVQGRYELIQKTTQGVIKSQSIKNFEVAVRAIFDKKLNFEILQTIMAK